MRGPTYRHHFTRGPFKGRDCRILAQLDYRPEYVKVRIRGDHCIWVVPLEHLASKNGHRPRKATRRPKP